MSDHPVRFSKPIDPGSIHGERQLSVKYFAVLRDETGTAEEDVRTASNSPAALFEELCHRYDLDLDPEAFQVAVNHELSTWETSLEDGDTVAFLPPVAGG